MRKLLILLTFLQGCTAVEVRHEDGSMPKLDIKSELCDDLKAKVRSDEFQLTCTLKIDGPLFSVKKD